MKTTNGGKEFVYMLFTMFTRINVPTFFMISGALLLGRDESIKDIMTKRVIRFVVVLLVFTLLNYALKYIVSAEKETFSIARFIVGTLKANIEGSYWFLYAYIGFLLMLPFMRKFAKNMTGQEFILLLVLHFLTSTLLPVINLCLKNAGEQIALSSDFNIPLATIKAFFYPLIGYYIDKKINIENLKKKNLGILLCAAIVGIVIQCVCTYFGPDDNGMYTQGFVQQFDYLTTIAVFVLVKYIINKIEIGRISGVLSTVASVTFGIYMMDPILKKLIYKSYLKVVEPYPIILESIGWCILSMVVGGVITFGLKKIPGVKKVL